MTGIVTQLKRSLGRISVKRITIALSICYIIGVVLLLQYNSIYVGDSDFDFIRIKPIIVGIEYLLYLLLPLLVVCIPIIITSKKHFGWFWVWIGIRKKNVKAVRCLCGWMIRTILCVLLMMIFAFFSGLMFHYFLPYTEYLLPDHLYEGSSLLSLVMISISFWEVYASYDVSWIAFAALLCSALAWSLKYCGYFSLRTAVAKRIYYAFLVILLPVGFITNMFYFLRDVYPNISQAVAGGAPVTGIITVESPGKQLRHDSCGNLFECNEVTKFCSVIKSDGPFWYVDEHLIGGINLGIQIPEYKSRPKTTRIPSCDIKQFTPLAIPMLTKSGRRRMFCQGELKDFVHNLDMFIKLRFSSPTQIETIKALGTFSMTNDITAICATDNLPLWKIHSSDQCFLKEGSTNLCHYINYRNLPLPTILTTSEFIGKLTNDNVWAQYVFFNLPEIPNCVFPVDVTLGFVVNYHMPIVVYSKPTYDRYSKVMVFSKGNVTANDIRSKCSSLNKDMNENNTRGNNMTNKVAAPTDSSSLNPPKSLK